MKRNLIIILVILAAAVAGFLYFTKDDVVFSKESSLYKAVPLSSPVFIEASSLSAIPADNPVIAELTGIPGVNKLLNQVTLLENTIKDNPEIQNQLRSRSFVLALDFVGKNVLHPLVISTLKSAKERQGLELLFEKLTGIPQTSFQKRNYNGYAIIDVTDTNGSNKLSFSVAGNMVIISPEVILVEKCIRQLNAPGITDNNYFQLVNKTVTRQSDVSWYINHRRFPELWANFLNAKTKTQINEFGDSERINLKRDVMGIKTYASWSELDMKLYDNRIAINGITAADDSLNHFLSVLEGQQAVSCNADRLLPKSTSFYIGFSFSDRELFFSKLESYFVHSESYYDREEKIKKIEQSFRSNSREKLRSLVKDKVIAAVTNIPSESEIGTLFVVNNPSRNESRETFESLLTNYAKRKDIELSSLMRNYTSTDGQTYPIYTFPFPSLPGIWLGGAFDFAKARYAAFYNETLVFASSVKGLENYLDDMDSGETLREDSDFESVSKSAESKANLNVYANVNKLYAMRQNLFNAALNKGLEKNEEIFRKFNAISWQVVCENNIYFNAVNLNYQEKPKKDVRSSWQCNLGAEVAIKPQIVINHTNKAQKEIIVQDKNNQLYLIDADGKILWSAPVSGRILGEIHQVDYYNNGKLQYLFNTSEKIYLLDRTGASVANFPVVLKSPATNGVSVFDYNNNNKYRYFVACEDKKVYAYDHEGKIISGWVFDKTAGKVTTPIQFFRVSNKDYIVFSDESKVYIQNRRGETRVNSSAQFSPSANDIILNTQGTPKLIVSAKDGDVYYLFFDGKFAKKETGAFSSDHGFAADDINGDGKPEFVITDENRLLVYNEAGDKLFEEKLESELLGPNLYAFTATKQLIGVTDVKENEIYLYEPNGKQYGGFPLNGNSAFSISKLKNGGPLCLVVGDDDGDLLCYELE
ncbi:DUF3352 domain-containing protein [Draconibacterium sp. IB214405]|uniref:DUF3352 domain-containing protein n=1 Tax=Draconibacterium sp. IB214405 TaxID=3097352 RepID=UPI002A119025|nr:PQQ-binding-like beta-propeller repeat protein [Draconibacterium sp. IB214405]MDX8341446.1 DUF3352 domain-containing protein [Draconibacterium sp. IB214405]